jgi:hypothetical protein
MTYAETSVILAQLLAEDRYPPRKSMGRRRRFQPLDGIRSVEPDPSAWSWKFTRRIGSKVELEIYLIIADRLAYLS